MSTLYKSVIKIRNAVSMQFQSTMITAVSFKTNQTDTAAQIVKNFIQLNFSSTRQDKNKLRKSD